MQGVSVRFYVGSFGWDGGQLAPRGGRGEWLGGKVWAESTDGAPGHCFASMYRSGGCNAPYLYSYSWEFVVGSWDVSL